MERVLQRREHPETKAFLRPVPQTHAQRSRSMAQSSIRCSYRRHQRHQKIRRQLPTKRTFSKAFPSPRWPFRHRSVQYRSSELRILHRPRLRLFSILQLHLHQPHGNNRPLRPQTLYPSPKFPGRRPLRRSPKTFSQRRRSEVLPLDATNRSLRLLRLAACLPPGTRPNKIDP